MSRTPIRRVLQAVQSHPWAIQPEKLEAMLGLLELRAAGTEIQWEAAKARDQQVRVGKIAVLPVVGVISQRMNMMSDFSGGTSTEQLGQMFDKAMADPEIGAIVFDVDSPGGSVYGVPELAAKIMAARGTKRTVAVANSLMASAAYWIGAAADEVVVTPSGELGSVGVVAAHADQSEFDKQMGVTWTFIHYGAYKVEGNPHGPLPADAKDFMQSRVNEYGDMFVKALADSRRTSQAAVRDTFGGGRVFGAKEAVDRGMANRVATLDQVVAELGHKLVRQAKAPRAVAEADLALRQREIDERAARQ